MTPERIKEIIENAALQWRNTDTEETPYEWELFAAKKIQTEYESYSGARTSSLQEEIRKRFARYRAIYQAVYERCKKNPHPNKEVAQREIEMYGDVTGQLDYLLQEIIDSLSQPSPIQCVKNEGTQQVADMGELKTEKTNPNGSRETPKDAPFGDECVCGHEKEYHTFNHDTQKNDFTGDACGIGKCKCIKYKDSIVEELKTKNFLLNKILQSLLAGEPNSKGAARISKVTSMRAPLYEVKKTAGTVLPPERASCDVSRLVNIEEEILAKQKQLQDCADRLLEIQERKLELDLKYWSFQ